jgi:hypothetical protein
VAYNDGLLFPKYRNKLHHVRNVVDDCILSDILGSISLTETPHVRSYSVKPCCGQSGQLMPPGVPAFRQTVTKEH